MEWECMRCGLGKGVWQETQCIDVSSIWGCEIAVASCII